MSASSNTRLPVGNKEFTNATVVIIGAGISGMCMAIDLIKRSKTQNFVILERSSSVGGTWNDNKYPGCCCDVWSSLYSYSFEQNPYWSREYPGQEEIHAYLVSVAEKYGLYKHIRFNSTVEEARWDDIESKWQTSVVVSGQKDSEFLSSYVLNSDFLVSAVGQLNLPRTPDIPGLEDFQGRMMHSARWDWSYDMTGMRIAIIGNGATATQITPEVARVASHLTIYQRTPNWVIPRLDQPTRGITGITESGIEVDGDEQEYDLIVLAAGFRTVEFMHPIRIYGTNCRSLEDIWRNGATALNGITVEDLPNFGMFYGPNTNLGHNSIILMIEAQSRYINTLVGEVMRARQQGKNLALKPEPSALERFNNRIQAILRRTSFADPNCNSWYKRDDGVITKNWAGTVLDYQRELSKVQWQDYIAEGTGKDRVVGKAATNKTNGTGVIKEEIRPNNMGDQ
ncbi:hypothetical protein PITC_056190 [Penicillium italicum]|uniref:Uncharacterized protein n=1 Tax=Penicillium italicum TaxID=40296 RepID=A0A0A2KIK0_PENIT|nr:hypothetical protein PITC_056190 [Penicillium italicum]